jgi:acyl-CoA reductase-like NAD-dependent aldehyde dehydrogenase
MLPTVLDDVAPDAEIATEEAFGPILAISGWTSEADAIRQANSVRYGLTASIWTDDINRAFRFARDLEVGYIWINDVETRYPAVPFGGWKDSGVGLENGLDELLSMTRVKAVNLALRA